MLILVLFKWIYEHLSAAFVVWSGSPKSYKNLFWPDNVNIGVTKVLVSGSGYEVDCLFYTFFFYSTARWSDYIKKTISKKYLF